MAPPNPSRQREARHRLDDFLAHPPAVWVIHYACQSFFQGQRLGSPRVTAIAARNLDRGETVSFSIDVEAELARLPSGEVPANLDRLERSLLDKFYEFLTANRAMRFVHWNMRDATYGFAAIEHRYRVLGGNPVTVSESQKLDMAKLFVDLYGSGYGGAVPRQTLAEANRLPMMGFLSGEEEARSFEEGNYRAVQNSTLVKVKLHSDLVELAQTRALKTQASWWTLNLGRVRESYEMFERNPLIAFASLLFAGLSTGLGLLWKYFG